MIKFFFKIYLILTLVMFPLKIAYCEVFIVAKVNQEIITNIDLDFEKRYLVSLNPNLKKLDQNRIKEYAKNSLINEKTDFTEFYNLIYEYKNDCLTASLQYNKDYYSDNELKPTEEIFFSISIVPLANLNTPSVR